MAITLNYQLNSKPTTSGTYVVQLRITENGQHSYYKTNIEVNKAKFDPKRKKNRDWVLRTEPNHKKWNDELDLLFEKARRILSELENKGIASRNKLKETLEQGERSSSFMTFAEEMASRVYEQNYNTYTTHMTFLNKLKEYQKGKDLMFTEIDLQYLNRFKLHLQRQPNRRNKNIGLNPNYISKLFDKFQAVYNEGVRELDLTIAKHPFKDLQLESVDVAIEKLTEEEIQAIIDLDLKEGSSLWHSRNYFLLSYYLGGIRVSDIFQMRGVNIIDGRIVMRTDKVSRMLSNIIVNEAMHILGYYVDFENLTSNYVFPELDNNASYAVATTYDEIIQLPGDIGMALKKAISSRTITLNKNLRKIAKLANIKKSITTKQGRHSFADFARRKGVDIFTISKVLGHSKTAMTEKYLAKLDHDKQDEHMIGMFKKEEEKKPMDSSLIEGMTLEQQQELFKELQEKFKKQTKDAK